MLHVSWSEVIQLILQNYVAMELSIQVKSVMEGSIVSCVEMWSKLPKSYEIEIEMRESRKIYEESERQHL